MVNKQEAYKVISNNLAQAKALIKECERLADETGESFTWSLGYGMGGTYRPANKIQMQALAKLTDEEKEALEINDFPVRKGGWNSSSDNC